MLQLSLQLMRCTIKQEIMNKTPHWSVSLLPFIILAVTLMLVIMGFGADALAGGSQVALIFSAGITVAIAMVLYRIPWKVFEDSILDNITSVGTSIVILLLIGAVSGSWMVSGVVPTMIYYGMKVIVPEIFLFATCVISALIAVMTGSSWTTIATIGVALMGIGRALCFDDGWIAGAIISGAYFGDKISLMSDTTVLASSTSEVPLFKHIQYMMVTTIPSMLIALITFSIAGFTSSPASAADTATIEAALDASFNLSPWLLAVPVLTAVLISKRLPAIITLFASAAMAAIAMVIAQPDVILSIAQSDASSFMSSLKAVILAATTTTSVETGNSLLNDLVTTNGMGGMMNTIWLIICAMCFGGVMYGSGMLTSISQLFVRMAQRTVSVVGSTVCSGIFFNLTTGDQYISIILTSNLFRQLYDNRQLERRLLSRSVEDSATITSVLIPWNSCGMAQSTVLGVATLTYLPYCIFNIVSPLMSILVAAIGYKIYPRTENEE